MTTSPVTSPTTFLGGYESDERLAAMVGPGGPFAVESIEVGGVPVRAFVNAPRTLIDLFGVAEAHADKDYLVYESDRYTFAEVSRQARALASALRSRYGVQQGDRVAVAMRNYPEFVTTMWATSLLGAVLVPLNSWWQASELVSVLRRAEPKVVFADSERLERLAAGGYADAGVPVVGVRYRGDEFPGAVPYAELIAGEPLSPDEYGTPEPDDLSSILFTSGTTGTPKGVMVTHRGTITNVMNMMFMPVRDLLLGGGMPTAPARQTAGILTTPLFHIGGLAAVTGAAISGGKTVLVRKWDVDDAVRLMTEEGVTGTGGVPPIAREMLEHKGFGELAGQITAFSIGAASVPPELPRLAREVLGEAAQIFNGYGSTETTSAVVSNVGADYAAHPDSVGRLNMTAELQVLGADGDLLGANEIGELCFRSPQVAQGYWNNPEATAESFVDGWFRSGDIGFIDDEGFVHVVDRLKDVIIRGGENVYCVEVEGVLFEHPAVLDVAAVGVADERMGERVCVVVLPRQGQPLPSLDDLRKFASDRLAAFKLPEALRIVDDLPRTATGKIAKKELKKLVADDPDSLIRE